MSQTDVKRFAQTLFSERPEMERLMSVFDHAQVHERRFAVDAEWFTQKHSFTAVNNQYIESALELSASALRDLARETGLHTRDFDIIFLVSTTGLSTPSLDARLANCIEMNPHIKRVPLWGLGCAGGVSAIARAHEYLLAHPTHRALIVAVELCGLAFEFGQMTKTNLISTALFGDGAAACLMIGDRVASPFDNCALPATLSSSSTLYPETLDVMGWNITGDGFKVQLSKDIPTIVYQQVRKTVIEFLDEQQISLADIEHFIMHPGGMKVLTAYSESLEIPFEKLEHSVGVLGDHGNMSSATIFYILKRFLEMKPKSTPSHGLISALGPGFSSEMVLVKWLP